MQYYVPYFRQLLSSNTFEPFIYHIFSGLDVKQVKDYVKKNKKIIDAFTPAAAAYFNSIRETQLLQAEDRSKQQVKYLFDDGELTGRGRIIG